MYFIATIIKFKDRKLYVRIENQIRFEFSDDESTGPVEGEGDGGSQRFTFRRKQFHVQRPGQRSDSYNNNKSSLEPVKPKLESNRELKQELELELNLKLELGRAETRAT
jgi:hypothetical protein